MAEYQTKRFLVPIKSGTWATNTTGLKYIIENADRRLVSLRFLMNVTLASIANGTASAKLDGLLKNVNVKLSDKAGDSRSVFNQGSSTLLHWQKLHLGKLAARTQRTILGQYTDGTYDVAVDLFFAHPIAETPGRWAQTVPLWKKNGVNAAGQDGLGSEIEVTVDTAAIGSAEMGLNTGTVTYNSVRLIAECAMIDQATSEADKLPYIPMVLATKDFDPTSASNQARFTLDEGGFCTSLLFEQFSSQSTGVRGTTLTTPASDWFDLEYKGGSLDMLIPVERQHEDELWADGIPTDAVTLQLAHNGNDYSATNSNALIFGHNFWHNSPNGSARRLNTCPNLYVQGNNGDLLKIKPTNVAANTRLRVTAHKFLTNNPGLLAGQ